METGSSSEPGYGHALPGLDPVDYGYAVEDLTEAEIAHRDDDFQFLLGVRAVA
jgi:hypothetical protein